MTICDRCHDINKKVNSIRLGDCNGYICQRDLCKECLNNVKTIMEQEIWKTQPMREQHE